MATFKVRNLLEMIVGTVCTLHLYLLYWAVSTKRELVRAGGRIPNAFLIIIPILNFYFWYKYVQSYLKIVRGKSSTSDTIVYFLVACFGPYLPAAIFKLLHHNATICTSPDCIKPILLPLIGSYVLHAIYVAGLKYFIFQKGFNEYKGQAT